MLDRWSQLNEGRVAAIQVLGQPAVHDHKSPRLVFPGSFNPLHVGHRAMAQWAARAHDGQVEFEISIQNVDKPLLDLDQVRQRLAQFQGDDRVWLTRAATFDEKAGSFPGALFLVGVDTLIRIADTGYYGGDVARQHEALLQLHATGNRFLVFGRQAKHGFLTLASLHLPPLLAQLCVEVPQSAFRMDVSSTQLRSQKRS